MVSMFETKMCNYCKKTKCKKKIIEEKDGKIITYKCNDYLKDSSKIIPYIEPLIVTAERCYVTKTER